MNSYYRNRKLMKTSKVRVVGVPKGWSSTLHILGVNAILSRNM
jgi:hypothetical protein